MPPQKFQPDETPDPLAAIVAMQERLVAAVELLAKRDTASPSDASGLLKAISQQNSDLVKEMAKQNARQVLPSNAQNEDGRSWNRPLGHLHEAYADLRFHRQPFFNGFKVMIEDLTVDEITAYNDLSKLLPGPGSRRTARGGKWKAWIKENDNELLISLPCKTLEDQDAWPATLVFILREFIDGKAVDVADMFSEILRLKAKVEELTGEKAALSV